MPSTPAHYLSFKQICFELKVSRWTVRRWRLQGCPFRTDGSIRLKILLTWLRAAAQARKLKMTVRALLALPPAARKALLTPLECCERELAAAHAENAALSLKNPSCAGS